MKKHIAALFAAVLATAGLVVATGGSASANCTASQYGGCIPTSTKATGPKVVAKGQKATVCATVKAKGSNATPTGRVVLKVTRNQGGFFFKQSVTYSGAEVCATTSKLQLKGGYSVQAKYKSPKGSTFANSTGGTGFDVAG